jgi:hypothetical protein
LTVVGLVAGVTLAGCLAKLSMAQISPNDAGLPIGPSEPAPAVESEDPEQVVKVFIEQNQKQAEGQLKKLKDEAEKVRARLQKVEASIKRWETYLSALKQSQVVAPPVTTEAPKSAVDSGPAEIRTEINELAPIAPSAPPARNRPSEPTLSTPKVPEPSIPRR